MMNYNYKDADMCDNSEAEIYVEGCSCNVEVENLRVHEPTMAHIRGRVCTQCGKPAKFLRVSLVKECDKCCRVVAVSRTDCEGRYEFHICVSGCGDKFKVVAHGKKHCKDECDHGCDKECECTCGKRYGKQCYGRDKGCGCGKDQRDTGCGCCQDHRDTDYDNVNKNDNWDCECGFECGKGRCDHGDCCC